MAYNTNRGFTLVELIVVIAIIGILSISGAYLMLYLVRHSVFIPNKLNADMIASKALDIMIEGDGNARGLRFSRSIADIGADSVTFNNQDGQIITYRWDTSVNKLYRTIGAGPSTLMPYYAAAGIKLSGKNARLFTYYDAGGAVIDPASGDPADVRRVEINLIAEIGSGSYDNWESGSGQGSSVMVWKFQ